MQFESSKFYPLNDLICTSSTCEINGKYYYIYNVGDINDNNVIIANAYRYDSNSDWANYHNAHNVTIMLTSDKFINGKDVDENFRVKYERKERRRFRFNRRSCCSAARRTVLVQNEKVSQIIRLLIAVKVKGRFLRGLAFVFATGRGLR